jgi:hypothetical protein
VAEGSELGPVIVNCTGTGLMVSLNCPEAFVPLESVTVIVRVYVPWLPPAGMPLSTPPALRVRPVEPGKPVCVQLYGGVPPLAVKVTGPKATPTVAVGSGEPGPVIANPGGLMVSWNGPENWWLLESVTVTVRVYVPWLLFAAVPLSTPPELRLRPPGMEGEPVIVQV